MHESQVELFKARQPEPDTARVTPVDALLEEMARDAAEGLGRFDAVGVGTHSRHISTERAL